MSSATVLGKSDQGSSEDRSGPKQEADAVTVAKMYCRYGIAAVSLILLNIMAWLVDGSFKQMAVILDFTATAGFLATIGVHVTGPWNQ